MAELHEETVNVRVGTRHPVTIASAVGSERTVCPVVEHGDDRDFYPGLVIVRTFPQGEGTESGGIEMRSQLMGEVINLPPVEELADNETVFVSGLVIMALDASGEFSYSGRVVSPCSTKRAEDGSIQGILSLTMTRSQCPIQSATRSRLHTM